MTFLKQIFYPIIFMQFFCFTLRAHGYFDNEKPVHHRFNAQILKENEIKYALDGDVNYGIMTDLEIGSDVILLALYKNINFSLKHRMFEFDNTVTTFTSEVQFPVSKSDDHFGVIAPVGIVTDIKISPNLSTSLGIYDLFLSLKGKNNLSAQQHIISAYLGADYLLNEGLALSAYTFQPIIRSTYVRSDFSDLEIYQHLFKGNMDKLSIPSPTFIGLTKSWETFNLTFGLATYDHNFGPIRPHESEDINLIDVTKESNLGLYLKLFWREL